MTKLWGASAIKILEMDETKPIPDVTSKGKIRFDEVYGLIGSFGVYQGALFFTAMIGSFWGAEVIFMNFVGYEPDHWCHVPELANFSYSQQKHIAIPSDNGEYK